MPGFSKINIAIALAAIVATTAYFTLNGSARQKNNDGQEQAGEQVKKDAWSYRCSGEGEQKNCEIAQRLSVKESGKRVVEMAIARVMPEGADERITRAVLAVPLGVAVQPGIKIRVDDNDETYSTNISHCRQDGCYAYMQIPDKLLNAMKAGRQARLAMATHQGKQMTIPMSLMGFTDAYSKLVQ